MTFALTSVKAYGIEGEEAVNKRYTQRLILHVTSANTDTALDIGNPSGTFWTAVGSSSDQAVAGLAALKNIQTKALTYIGAMCTQMAAFAQVASGPSGSQYTVAMDSTYTQLPKFTFVSGSAPTTYDIVLNWILKDAEVPTEVSA